MNAVSLGPLVLAADRFAVILGMFIFLVVTGGLARKIDPRFNSWSWIALVAGIGAARVGHVLLHLDNFLTEPLRIISIWDGGFYAPAGILAVMLSFLMLKGARLRGWALLPVVLGLVVWNMTAQFTGGTRSVPLPQLAFETLAGEPLALEEVRGKPMVVNLWATWCPPCRREMPMMADVARSTPGTVFIFANQGEGRGAVGDYLERNGIMLDHVLLDSFGQLRQHYGAPGLPATLFIDAGGVLRHAHLGEISRETLQARIEALTSDTD